MKKILGVLAFVFAASFAIGLSSNNTADAANCYYTCSCSGQPLRCCVNNGVTTCKPAIGFQCPQVYNC